MEIDLISQLYRQEFLEFKYPVWTSKWNTLILVEEGEYQLRLEGWQKPVVLKANDIALVPPGVQYERKALTSLMFYHLAFNARADHPFYQSVSGGRLPLSAERTQPILQSIKRAMILPDNRELLTHIIGHIFAEHYLFGRTKKTKLVPFSKEVTETVNYINRHLDQRLDVDELATRVYLSHSGLIWKFKKELGTTPSRYISLQRLRYAKQLLLNHPGYSIAQVSEMCGYSNPFYFTNLFHDYSGMSPSDFRRYHLKK